MKKKTILAHQRDDANKNTSLAKFGVDSNKSDSRKLEEKCKNFKGKWWKDG